MNTPNISVDFNMTTKELNRVESVQETNKNGKGLKKEIISWATLEIKLFEK